jgi:hypothetical protein
LRREGGKKMKNSITRVAHAGWIWIISICYLSYEASLEGSVLVENMKTADLPQSAESLS